MIINTEIQQQILLMFIVTTSHDEVRSDKKKVIDMSHSEKTKLIETLFGDIF